MEQATQARVDRRHVGFTPRDALQIKGGTMAALSHVPSSARISLSHVRARAWDCCVSRVSHAKFNEVDKVDTPPRGLCPRALRPQFWRLSLRSAAGLALCQP